MDLPASDLAERLLEQRQWLRALARRLAAPDEADELEQETWLAALERPPARAGQERPWLAAVARNLARGLRRTQSRRARHERQAARAEALPATAELVERLDAEQRLARELLLLREPYRTTLLLRFHEGLAAAGIAARQGVPAGTVRWRTKQGLAELRARLERAYGGRELMGVALLALTRDANPPPAVVGTASGLAGGVVMSLGSKAIAGAVAVVVLVGAAVGVARLGTRGVAESSERERLVWRGGDAPRASDEPLGGLGSAAAPAGRAALETESAPSLSRRARLRVLESDRTPHADRRVAVGTADGLETRTDTDGWVELVADEGTCELAIERERAFPYRVSFRRPAGLHELVLPEGEVLAGRVVVRGGTPEETLQLDLHPAGGFEDRASTSEDLFASIPARLWTDPDGGFEFRGLEQRAYELELPRGYARAGTLAFSDPDACLVLRDLRPGRGQLVELERYPSLRGRIVEPDGTPTAGLVEAMVTWQDGTTLFTSARAEHSGRFELFLEKSWRAVLLDYHGLPGVRGGSHMETTLERAPDGDLGDLVLAPGRTLTLHVRARGGLPIARAVTDLGSEPTDENGATVLRGVTGSRVRVLARGFGARSAELPPEGETALSVELEPAPELVLDVRDARGTPVPELDVRLVGPRPFFLEHDGRSPDSLRSSLRDGRFSSGGMLRSTGEFSASFQADGSGRLSVDALAPGIPLRVLVLAHGGVVVHEQRLDALGEYECRTQTIVLARELVRLHGRVLDEQGLAIAGARIGVAPVSFEGHTRYPSLRSDAQGRFERVLLDLCGLELSVEKRGYLPLVLAFPSVPEQGLELVLRRGLDVHVRVEDEAGALQPGGQLTCRCAQEGSSIRAEAVGVGRFELAGLEPGLHELTLEFGGGTFRLQHDAHDPQAVFRTPRAGAVQARWEIASTEPALRWLTLALEPLAPGRVPITLDGTDEPRGTRLIDPVLPGEYELVLRYDGGGEPRELARAVLAVTAGEPTSVELRATWP